jgi:hypothetical protein
MSKLMALVSISVLAFAACGGDDGGGGMPDAPPAPAMITISGTATERDGLSTGPAVGVLVEAFERSNESTPVAMTMTDAAGMYSLTVTTDGVAVDGYLRATRSGWLDTYLYPPEPLTADFDGASLNIINQSTFDLLSNTLCQANQVMTNGAIGMLVVDAAEMPVAGATIASSPAATDTCYNSNGTPSNGATATDDDGIGYLFNVTGDATVSAMATGHTFRSHGVKARAGALTTTVITP